MKNFLTRNSKFIKWIAISIAVLAFATRLYIGETLETKSSRSTGETRYDGSAYSFVLIAIMLISLIVFVVASFNSKTDQTKE
jgi:hypothetical protein